MQRVLYCALLAAAADAQILHGLRKSVAPGTRASFAAQPRDDLVGA